MPEAWLEVGVQRLPVALSGGGMLGPGVKLPER